MALTYPIDLLDGFPGWSTEFDLLWRQEQSRQANGRTIVKDLGSPLWRATYQSRSMKPNELDAWRARLNAMENGLGTFYGRPTSRCFPIADPGGRKISGSDLPSLFLDFTTNVGYVFDASGVTTLDAISPNRKELAITGLPPGYVLSIGDYISITYATGVSLHQLVSGVTADAGGYSGIFEVRPHLWPGVTVGNDVRIVRPHCVMALVPGSVSITADMATGRGVVSFQAIEAR